MFWLSMTNNTFYFLKEPFSIRGNMPQLMLMGRQLAFKRERERERERATLDQGGNFYPYP